jgi:tetratricopeptide (TPR) repeat protein
VIPGQEGTGKMEKIISFVKNQFFWPGMRFATWTGTMLALLILCSCRDAQQEMKREIERIRSQQEDPYTLVYAYAAYLSNASNIEPDEAISMVSEMIASGYPTEARYAINNLMNNGVTSHDLLALRGLCYAREFQQELALQDLEKAMEGDPGNEKIEVLLDQVKGGERSAQILGGMTDRAFQLLSLQKYVEADSALNTILELEDTWHRALYLKALIRVHEEQYDSALFYLAYANSLSGNDQYEPSISRVNQLIEGEKEITAHPGSFNGYLAKSQAFSFLGMYEDAQETLDRGLSANPDHLNLILAKALVWVQEGKQETARQYLREQEQRGVRIDPGVKQQVLQETE